MNETRKYSLLAALVSLFLAGSVASSDFDEGSGFTGIKVGIVGSGPVDIDGIEADQSTGLSIGLSFDFPAGERLHYGVAINLMQMNWQVDGASLIFDESQSLVDLGLCMKAHIGGGESSFAFRPGVGIGLGLLPRFGPFRGSNYLTLRAFGEFIYFPDSGPGWLIDVGTWYAPEGGDGDFDISIGPLLTLRAGLLF